jgi:hypothetical protein
MRGGGGEMTGVGGDSGGEMTGGVGGDIGDPPPHEQWLVVVGVVSSLR